MKKTLIGYYFLSVMVLGAVSCSSDDDNSNPTDQSVAEKSAVIENYANLVFKNYQDAYDGAKAMQTAINTFVATPTQVNFDAAKAAWKTARETYGQTEAFRFASGPIDDNDGPEGVLNAWPLDENYVDYVSGNANSGIINDPTTHPTINKAALEVLNEDGGEKNISVGYHAIEFLLWGQDNSLPSAKEAGQRPFTDFVDGGTASNQSRRRDYLAVCADLLLDHLQLLLDEWKVNGTYRSTFLALEADVALKNMLTGISTLAKSELAGERVFVAYDNQNQEDEHSCFSDNTHRDLRLNLAGVANVFRGSYTTINGSSLEDLITKKNATLGAEITAQLAAAESAVNATATPFDFAISDAAERPKVIAAVNALRALGDKFVEGGNVLGITVSSDLPE
ncbi:imelysin family protein [Aquimarina macrocephali]|uniref:imelysin family protein n=1 Tax=Aquimarina macrocephali TaxID=666563 RepID=UPI000464E076|nr:imelysin family protein [Aquimarina macrocephali]